MTSETTADALKQNLDEILRTVQTKGDSVLIRKDGQPVAALIDAALFERIRQMGERFDELSAQIAEAYAKVPEAEGMAEIERITSEVRAEMNAERRKAKG